MAGVPSNIMIPWVGVEFDSSRASTEAEMPITLLLVGQRLSTGTVPAETKFSATTADEVGEKAGLGSMLHRMAIYAFKNNGTVPVVCIGLDDATGTPGTVDLGITGTATKSGEIDLYIAGERFALGVEIGDLAADIGTALAALINLDINLQVTAAWSTNKIVLTCRHDGIAASDLDVRYNYNAGEKTPAGITLAAPAYTAGTVDPDIQDAIDALGGSWFNVVAQPYTDNTNMGDLQDYLDTLAGPMEQRAAFAYQAKRDTHANMVTFGEDTTNHNNEWTAILPAYKRLQSTYEISAAVSAAVARSIAEDPAVPLHRISVKGISALDSNDLWTPTERNTLARASVCTFTDERGVQTESMVTLYRKNSAGALDTAYQQQNTMFILSALRFYFVNQILTKYPRAKLTTSAEGIGAGQQIMSVDIGKAEAVAWFLSMQRRGYVEGGQAVIDQFKNELVVERDESNLNRMNWLLPPDLMNQFIVGSGIMQFRG